MLLKGRRVLVTGSSRGIGRATALRLAEMGASVVVHYNSDRTSAETVIDAIAAIGGTAFLVQGDLTNESTGERIIGEAVGKMGGLDILVNNVGKTVPGHLEDFLPIHWAEQIQINFLSAVYCCRAALSHLRMSHNAHIVNVASIRGLVNSGRPGAIAYSAAKAALINFTVTLAKDVAPQICVNAIAPGVVETDYLSTLTASMRDMLLKQTLLGRFLQPAEIAHSIGHLVTSNAITGAVYVVDAGSSAGPG